ncbi:Serine/threonine-protein kinase [Actinidia chinensis var. chinensis]|uniref:RING-type E3 ubiquitin transferase n=1 Tax=Actinidia chinensis var. chinensis TaxID=1590841 RepID=A0A2R6R0A2_ACTCC|nr:Serine/threonine-protein kinase [Actinidia chinensis var. chinensis]
MAPSSISSVSTSSRVSKGGGANVTTAIAIDKDKNSESAVRWAIDNLVKKVATVILVHVKTTQSLQSKDDVPKEGHTPTENEMQEFFLPYRGFCARKGVRAKELVLHDIDISNALVDFISNNSISNMVLGASSRNALTRAFRNVDVPTSLCKTAPDFCSVYVVAKGKVQITRSASQPSTPGSATSSKRSTIFSVDTTTSEDIHRSSSRGSWRSGCSERISFDRSSDFLQSTPHDRVPRSTMASPQQSISSMVSSPQHPASNLNLRVRTRGISSIQDSTMEICDFSGPPSFQSTDMSFENLDQSRRSDVSRSSVSSTLASRELEAEMRRLKIELKQTMDMYNSACKEAVTAKEKEKEIDRWKTEEACKLQAAKEAQEAAMALAEMEKQKTKVALEAAMMARRLAELEVQKRKNAEMKAMQEAKERRKAIDALSRSEIRYRKYDIEQIEIATDHFSSSLKIGEGGYGPVYKAFLDHTAVAIKVLRPEMSQGKKQFQREVEVLSYMRHPNMVLLLGACPEYGCLVYEHMENGSLEDRLFRKNNTPPIPWRLRFKIAAEIATALLFLHQTKPEPLVHRDLKPANILLDRNYVSKISDVGLARLVPSSVADCVTQYQMTAAAGTFCYIDPEYQQTGMLGVKSDIYSFGIMLLQIITAKPPIGLTHHVGRAIERGTFSEMLDPMVTDWPFEEALSFAKLAVQCCELRRKDRPDLGSVILPELQRLSNLGSDNGPSNRGVITYGSSFSNTSFQVKSPLSQESRRRNLGMQREIQSRFVLNEGGGRSISEIESEV